MTTIILVVVGVLLAAVAALMIVFYGGDVFTRYHQEAEAGRLVNEGAQIEAAVELYYQREMAFPDGENAIDVLVDEDYLVSIPKGFGGTNGDWTIDYEEGHIRSTVGSADDDDAISLCVTARRQLKIANPEDVKQCDGSDSENGRLHGLEPCCIRNPST